MKAETIAANLVTFIEAGTTPASLTDAVEILGNRNARVVVISILGWLNWRWRSGRDVTLKLRQQYRWCNDLRVLLKHSPGMRQFFRAWPTKLSFRCSVSAEDRTAIVNYVHEHYKPTLHVHHTLEAWKKYKAEQEAQQLQQGNKAN